MIIISICITTRFFYRHCSYSRITTALLVMPLGQPNYWLIIALRGVLPMTVLFWCIGCIEPPIQHINEISIYCNNYLVGPMISIGIYSTTKAWHTTAINYNYYNYTVFRWWRYLGPLETFKQMCIIWLVDGMQYHASKWCWLVESD
jgi:hypothetical protein